MKRHIFAICVIIALCFISSCFKDPNPEPEKYITLSIDVDVDTTDITTKTYMDGQTGFVKWKDTDSLWVYFVGLSYGPVKTGPATNIHNDGRSATFTYQVPEGVYWQVYDADKYVYYGNYELVVKNQVPKSIKFGSVQEYAGTDCFSDYENASLGFLSGFHRDIGKTNPDSVCVMKNLFGILKVNISLADAKNIDYIQLTDNLSGNYLAGEFSIDSLADYKHLSVNPYITHKTGTGGESLSVIKKVSGNVTGGDFYFLVPPGTLFSSKGFNLYVYTTDGYYAGKKIKLSSTGQASIERSVITYVPIKSFTPKPVPTPLPLTANSYVVPATAGPYSIPAQYMGNGFQGNRVGKFTSADTYGAKSYEISGAVSADIIWQGRLNGDGILDGEVVSKAVYYTKDTLGINNYGFIGFHRSGVEGDALVALKDASGNILWSWHLWIVDQSDVAKIEEGEWMYTQYGKHNPVFRVMDRNLGALSATPDGLSQFHGLAYQYGRKDPYMGTRFSGPNTDAKGYESFATIYPGTGIYCVTNTISIAQSVLTPNVRSVPSNGYWCTSKVYWGDPNGDSSKDSPKTLYDPCPAGWRTFEEKNLSIALGLDSLGKIARPIGEVVMSGEGMAFKFANTDSVGVSHPVYFPGAGYSASTTEVTQIGQVAGFWAANYYSNQAASLPSQATYVKIALTNVGSGTGDYTSDIPHQDLFTSMPVRCQKWEEPANPSLTASSTQSSQIKVLSTKGSEFLEEEIVTVY